jgi:hypothetical protein
MINTHIWYIATSKFYQGNEDARCFQKFGFDQL